MPDSTLVPRCPACKAGRLQAVTRSEIFRPNGIMQMMVELLASRSDACGVESTRASQLENLRRLAARKEHYGDLLMGEEIVALRKRYGLTQRAASRIEKPDSLKWLPDKSGIEIPLWPERCEDAKAVDTKRGATKPAAREIEAPKALPATKKAAQRMPALPARN